MKQSFITITLALAVLSIPLHAISESSITKSLSMLGNDLKSRLPENVKNISVYGVLKDAEKRYSDALIGKIVSQKIRESRRTVIDRSAGMEAGMGEMELSASGVIDIATVKSAGKMAGVDAFVFVFPSVDGLFGERLTIMVKAVSVTTGSVVFVKEYTYEEKFIVGLTADVQYPFYKGYSISSTVMVSNAVQADWTDTIPGQVGMAPLVLKAVLNIPEVNITVGLGIGMTSVSSGDGFGYTTNYFADMLTTNTTVQGFRARGISPVIDISLPVSYLFGDNSDSLRLRAGSMIAFLVSASPNGRDGNVIKADGATAAMNVTSARLEFSQPGMIIVPIFSGALEYKFLSGISVFAGVEFMPSWSADTEVLKGINANNTMQMRYSGTGGVAVSAGISYKIL